MGNICGTSNVEARQSFTLPAKEAAPVYQNHHFDSTKWQVVKPRPDDIVIATAYKSGTTWMQKIISEILFQGQEPPSAVHEMSPWVDLRVPPAHVLGPMLEAQTHRRFMKTHLPFDAFQPFLNPSGKIIYVGRDGRDMFMSLANHYEKGNEKWYGALNGPGLVGPPLPPYEEITADGLPAWFDKWLVTPAEGLSGETDGYPFWSAFKNVRTWWEYGQANPDRVLFVHFNNLLADLAGEMVRIAKFLEVPVNESLLPSMVEACTFDAMKGKADASAPAGGLLFKGGGDDFIFKGTNGRWKGVLTEAQIEAYKKKVAQELSHACAKWLETGV